MSAQLKEALAVLGPSDCKGTLYPSDFRILRAALTAALREAAAWSDITAFQRANGDEYDLIVGLADEESEADGEYLVRFIDLSDGSDEGMRFPGASRVEALEAAAVWCRGEL